MIYNRASADPDGRPWSERKKYVWWDADEGKWTSLGDSPDFPPTKAPDYKPEPDAKKMEGIRATRRSSSTPTAAVGCTRPPDSWTGPCRRTTSPTSRRSAIRCTHSSRTRRARSSRARSTHTTRPGARREQRSSRTCSDLPAHRTSHRRRHVAHCSLPGRAPARVLLRGIAGAGRRARPRARRLGHDRDRPQRRRGSRDGDRAHQATRGAGPNDAPGRRAVPLGRSGDRHGRLRQRAPAPGARQQRAHQRVQGRDVRHQARPPPTGRRPARARGGVPEARGGEDVGGRRVRRTPRLASASSQTRRSASAARRARWRARSGTRSRCRSRASPASRSTTASSSTRTGGATSPSWSSACRRASRTARRSSRRRRAGRRSMPAFTPTRRATESAG